MFTVSSDLFQAYKATQPNGPAPLYTAFHWQVFDALTLQKKKKKVLQSTLSPSPSKDSMSYKVLPLLWSHP